MGTIPSPHEETRTVTHAMLKKNSTRKVARKKPNTEVLELCNITGIEGLLIKAQFRWTGNVKRKDDNRMLKTIFFSELANEACSRGGQRKRYKTT